MRSACAAPTSTTCRSRSRRCAPTSTCSPSSTRWSASPPGSRSCTTSPSSRSRRCSSTSTWRSTATSTSPSPPSASVLDQPRFTSLPAGIVLQAYLPDTHDVADELLTWVAERHRAGGAPVKVRLVKGANLAMEQVDAELGGWVPAPYPTKADVDASYKALLGRLLDAAEHGGLVVGVGSHNLFDVAWALGERDRRGPPRRGRHRDARRHGAAAVAGDAGRRRRAAALHTRRHRRGLRGEHRLPVASTRRERGTGELPPFAVHDHARLAGLARRTRALRGRRRRQRRPCRASRAGPRTGAPSSAASIPTRRSPTSRTPTSRRLPTGRGSATPSPRSSPAELPALVTTTDGIDDVVRRARDGAARWSVDDHGRTPAHARPRGRGDGGRTAGARSP